jgi:soluble lytic murein transglycosylase
MLRRRPLLLLGLVLAVGVWLILALFMGPRRVPIPIPAAKAVVFDPFQSAPLRPYGRFLDALRARDTRALEDLLPASSGYLTYRILLALAQDGSLPASARAGYFKRALTLRVVNPLAKKENRKLELSYAQVAEQAGLKQDAVAAYRQALPDKAAVSGLKRLADPLKLADVFLQAGRYQGALNALAGRHVPSIAAPAYRALGQNQQALAAYERWLAEDPDSATARYGKARALLALGKYAQADALFAALPGAAALYGRALVAEHEKRPDEAITYLLRTGEAAYMWRATGLLEQKQRFAEAIGVYLKIAEMNSSYADDAAYRALVLARRTNDQSAAAKAEKLLPAFSFLGQQEGKPLGLPQTESSLPPVPSVLELANALARANDLPDALGELRFALRAAPDEQTSDAIGQALEAYGAYYQAQRAAESYLQKGSQDLRTWKLAYPQAYASSVLTQAKTWDVAPALIWAVMRQESRFYPRAVSSANAQGLMQVIPSTWNWLAGLLGESPADPFDPAANIRYGAFYLHRLLQQFHGDLELVVPAYNGGPGYVGRLYASSQVNKDKADFLRFIDKSQTREYLQQVLLNYEVYRALYPPAQAARK